MQSQYAFDQKSALYMAYFSILGLVSLSAGIVDIIVTVSGAEYSAGILEIPNSGFRGVWGGLVMVFAGCFYLSGIRSSNEIHQFAKVVLGSILLWILSGTDIFAIITGSIPSEDAEHWFNTSRGFIDAYAPPYTPALILLPFSLFIIFYIRKYRLHQSVSIDPVTD